MAVEDHGESRLVQLESLRILREYRRLVLMGRARLPIAEARRLVGPDCAFHLYFRHAPAAAPASAPARVAAPASAAAPATAAASSAARTAASAPKTAAALSTAAQSETAPATAPTPGRAARLRGRERRRR